MAALPDPTVDLDWSGYVGSIQSIFSENAQKHPDRICVVETKSSESPERIFTYRQIHEASNLVAHHLHEAGVEHGDVVMIWAHRSVDLVVAIMGTLVCSCLLQCVWQSAVCTMRRTPASLAACSCLVGRYHLGTPC